MTAAYSSVKFKDLFLNLWRTDIKFQQKIKLLGSNYLMDGIDSQM